MRNRFALFAAPFALALTAAAPASDGDPVPEMVRVAMTTEMGTIVVELDGKNAPTTTGNFLRYADQKRFDDITFYRAMHLGGPSQPSGLIQAGTQGDHKRTMKPIAHEPTSATGILHKAGTISMARHAPGTASGDFFILLSDMPSLDADPASANPEAAAGFAAFGHVVKGMDVVQRIWSAPLSQTKGEGVMRGQMLEAPVRLITVRRAASAPATP